MTKFTAEHFRSLIDRLDHLNEKYGRVKTLDGEGIVVKYARDAVWVQLDDGEIKRFLPHRLIYQSRKTDHTQPAHHFSPEQQAAGLTTPLLKELDAMSNGRARLTTDRRD